MYKFAIIAILFQYNVNSFHLSLTSLNQYFSKKSSIKRYDEVSPDNATFQSKTALRSSSISQGHSSLPPYSWNPSWDHPTASPGFAERELTSSLLPMPTHSHPWSGEIG